MFGDSYDSYGGYGGGGLSSLMSLIPNLIPIALLLAAIFFGPRLWKRFMDARRGQAREPLMPAGDPMRYALASAVLKGSIFRRRIINMARNPFLASAPELGLHVPLLVNACKRMEDADKRWQWTFAALLITPFVLPTLVAMFGLYQLFGLAAMLGTLAWLAIVVLAVYRRWLARFRDVRPFRAEEYDLETVRQRFGEATGIEAGFDENQSNVVVFGETVPFVGFGAVVRAWQVGVDLNRPSERGGRPGPVSTEDVYSAVLNAVRELNIPNLRISDVAFVNGTMSNSVNEVQADRFDAPAHALPEATLRAWRAAPDAPARVYAWIRVPTSNGEVTQNYLFRCVRRGESLLIETYQTAVLPVARSYREVDSIRRLGLWGLIVWAGTAIALTPLSVLNALIGVFGQVSEFIGNIFGGPIARERKEIRLNPMYNYGARESVREWMMGDRYQVYFQSADGAQMNSAIDLQVLNATTDVLQAAGVDVSSFTQQSGSIMQSNVNINTGGGAFNAGGSANIGGVVAKAAGAAKAPAR